MVVIIECILAEELQTLIDKPFWLPISRLTIMVGQNSLIIFLSPPQFLINSFAFALIRRGRRKTGR